MSDIQLISKQFGGNSANALCITNKYIKDEDWERISYYLEHNTGIISLEFSGVKISSAGLFSLAEIVKNFLNLKELKLDWNDLSELSSEFDYLVESLIQSNINILYLNNNKINHNLYHSLTKLVKHAVNLSFIDLRWNEINDDGAKVLLEVLKKNTYIQYLNIVGNKILNNKLLSEINDCLMRNKQFQENQSKNPEFNSTSHSMMNLRKSYEEKDLLNSVGNGKKFLI